MIKCKWDMEQHFSLDCAPEEEEEEETKLCSSLGEPPDDLNSHDNAMLSLVRTVYMIEVIRIIKLFLYSIASKHSHDQMI